jgi:hypothetical protein
LTDLELYNAVGNHFDVDAVWARLVGPLSRAVAGPGAGRHHFIPPADLVAIYFGLQQEVQGTGRGIPTEPSPFPEDLHGILASMMSSVELPLPPSPGTSHGGGQPAAEDGRRGE